MDYDQYRADKPFDTMLVPYMCFFGHFDSIPHESTGDTNIERVLIDSSS
jgi:hypothetical protein